MYIDRKEMIEELKLRKHIRKAIMTMNERKMVEKEGVYNEELKLRNYIRELLNETDIPDPEESPHKSTGINVLEDLLKKIIPIIEIDFKKLTTSQEQRDSFRAHVVQATKNTLIPPRVTDEAGEQSKFIPISEQIAVNVGTPAPTLEDPNKFIDIDGATPKSEEEKEQEQFGLSGEDETGRDMAYSVFKKVEGNILDSWEILSNDDDKKLFFDYLVTNLKLYFDKFEDELKATIPEPTTDEYEEEIGATEAPPGEDLGIPPEEPMAPPEAAMPPPAPPEEELGLPPVA